MIERTDLNNLRVMDFFQTLTNIAAHLNNEDLAVLKLENAVNNIFTPALTAMDEALKPFRKTGLTDPLLTHDAERDAAIVGLSAHVRAFLAYPQTDKAQAAARLKLIIDKYGRSPQNLPQREQTGAMANLLQDLDTNQGRADLTAIIATPWAVALQTANTAFENLYNERTRANAAIETGKTRAARAALQEAFALMARTINALMLLEGEEPYRILADNINTEVRQALATRRGGGKTTEEPQTPETPEE